MHRTPTPRSALKVPRAPVDDERARTSSIGKRKPDEREDDGSPPDARGSLRATRFADQDSRGTVLPRPALGLVLMRCAGQRVSDASHGSYYRKRPRTEPLPALLASPPGTPRRPGPAARDTPRSASGSSSVPQTPRSTHSDPFDTPSPRDRRASALSGTPSSKRGRRVSTLSGASIPVSAIVAPRAPSLGPPGVYRMRDPALAAPRATPWLHGPPRGWVLAFWAGFVLFPLWWAAALWPVAVHPAPVADAEKGLDVDADAAQDAQDARTWRTRCRVVAGVSLLTYVPFVVLVAWFATR
jgi:hypothetical protein